MELTKNTVLKLVKGEQVDKPVLQVLKQKTYPGKTENERFKMHVSDGKHSYSNTVLAIKLSPMALNGEIYDKCVARVEHYVTNMVQSRMAVVFTVGETIVKHSVLHVTPINFREQAIDVLKERKETTVN